MENNKDLRQEVAMQHPNYSEELINLIRSNISPKALKDKLLNYHENDIAIILKDLTISERKKLYQILNADELSNILEYTDNLEEYINEIGIRKKVDILSSMDTDVTVDYLKTISKADKNTLVELMSEEKRQEIACLWSYAEDEIGSIMTTNFIEISSELSIKEAMHSLIEQSAEHDNISTIYVVDKSNTFYGAIDLKDLIIAREGTDLASITATSYPYVYAQEQIAECIPRIQNYSEDSIPVLDNENKLLGVITAQDFIQVVDDQLSDDYAKLAGLSSEEDLQEPLKVSIQKRLPWLVALLALGMLVSSVVGLFEGVVEQITIVVCFQSLVLDMAGNVGTQSLAVTIRVLMDEQIAKKQKLHLVLKEAKVGLINGMILGSASFVTIGGYLYLIKKQTLILSFSVSACIGIALVVSMLLSSISGTVVPIFFKMIKVDPAVASGPLITTINDLVAVVSYYGLTWLLLIEILKIV